VRYAGRPRAGEFGPAFGDTWGRDLRARAGLPGSIFAVARHRAAAAAGPAVLVGHMMLAFDPEVRPRALAAVARSPPAQRGVGMRGRTASRGGAR
jgi:hypothetical protein